jgi:hypothetical protein
MKMAVQCGGDSRVMEQLGEKQDFECKLSRLGFKHEDFALYVRRESAHGTETVWAANYTVQVANTGGKTYHLLGRSRTALGRGIRRRRCKRQLWRTDVRTSAATPRT